MMFSKQSECKTCGGTGMIKIILNEKMFYDVCEDCFPDDSDFWDYENGEIE